MGSNLAKTNISKGDVAGRLQNLSRLSEGFVHKRFAHMVVHQIYSILRLSFSYASKCINLWCLTSPILL